MAPPRNLLAELEPLIGRWRSSGVVLDEFGQPTMEISGTDEYEWMPGMAWMIHHVDVMMGNERTRALELFGDYDATRNCLLARAFDASGRFDTMTLEKRADGSWRFTGDGIRSTLWPRPDKSGMTAEWERVLKDGSWIPWMQMQFTPAA